MKCLLLSALLAGWVAGSAAAEPDTSAAPQSAAADAINNSISDYEDARRAFMEKLRAEKDGEAARRLFKEAPDPMPHVERILTLAEKNPAAPEAKKAAVWCSRQARKPVNRQRVSKLFIGHYLGDPVINAYARSLSRSYAPDAVAQLRTIIEKSPRKDTKIYAAYYLATRLGDARLNFRLNKDEKEAYAAESLKLMKQLRANPEVKKLSPKLAERVAVVIFERENLAIGCTAPDIVGDDHTGAVFKLSDYRGKVVLLDFWGYW